METHHHVEWFPLRSQFSGFIIHSGKGGYQQIKISTFIDDTKNMSANEEDAVRKRGGEADMHIL